MNELSMPASKGLSRRLKIGVLVHEVSRLRRRAMDQVLQPLGVTGTQWWVLTYVSLRPGLSQVKLADELSLGKVALGGIIDRMMKLNLIERRPHDQDKRVNLIFLSDAGMALAREIRQISTSVRSDALEGVAQDQLDVAISVLVKMKDNLERTTGVDQNSRIGALV